MSPSHRVVRLASLLGAFLSFAYVAYADRAPADWRTTMVNTAKQAGMPSYERTLPNGTKRVYLNPQAQHLPAVEGTLSKGSDVIEILHIGTPNANHTMAIFDRRLLHSQYRPNGLWRLRSWGDRLRPSGTKLWSAMIALKPNEAANLRAHIAAAEKEEGDEWAAGDNWEKGHLNHGGALGVRQINCVSTWCDMPIGEHGETLHQLVGLNQSFSGNPRGFQLALETQANERVFGIAEYGPADPAFTQNQQQDKTFK